MAETSHAKCGDLSLAYEAFGDGPIELVFVRSMVTYIELLWTLFTKTPAFGPSGDQTWNAAACEFRAGREAYRDEADS